MGSKAILDPSYLPSPPPQEFTESHVYESAFSYLSFYLSYCYKQIPVSSGLLLLITLVYSLLLLAHNFYYSGSFMALLPMVLLPLFSKVFFVVVVVVVFNIVICPI